MPLRLLLVVPDVEALRLVEDLVVALRLVEVQPCLVAALRLAEALQLVVVVGVESAHLETQPTLTGRPS